jgi:predicted thioesterase
MTTSRASNVPALSAAVRMWIRAPWRLLVTIDSATVLTLLAGLPPELTAVTTHLDTEFVKPAPIGTLLVKARVTSRRDRDAVVEAEILDTEGNSCARAVAKLRIVRRALAARGFNETIWPPGICGTRM